MNHNKFRNRLLWFSNTQEVNITLMVVLAEERNSWVQIDSQERQSSFFSLIFGVNRLIKAALLSYSFSFSFSTADSDSGGESGQAVFQHRGQRREAARPTWALTARPGALTGQTRLISPPRWPPVKYMMLFNTDTNIWDERAEFLKSFFTVWTHNSTFFNNERRDSNTSHISLGN